MEPKKGQYIAALARELEQNTAADKVAGGVSQKALFRRRGTIELREDALVLSGWGDDGDLALTREDITGIRREYTKLYGRLIGGLLDSGKPLILATGSRREIYLLIDRKEFMETTRNREWQQAIDAWRQGARR